MQHEVPRWPDAGNSDIKQKAARRRLLNSILMMDQTNLNAGFDLRRYPTKPTPAKPRIIIAHVEGSGTAPTVVAEPVKANSKAVLPVEKTTLSKLPACVFVKSKLIKYPPGFRLLPKPKALKSSVVFADAIGLMRPDLERGTRLTQKFSRSEALCHRTLALPLQTIRCWEI